MRDFLELFLDIFTTAALLALAVLIIASPFLSALWVLTGLAAGDFGTR